MQRSLLDQNEPILHAESFLSDQKCRSLLASAIRPVRHNAPLQLSCRCKAQEPSLIDSWRADSESLSMAPARNSPMCECTSQECAELFSLSSSLSSNRKHFWFSTLRNRDGISARRLNVEIFTRRTPKADSGGQFRTSATADLRPQWAPKRALTGCRQRISLYEHAAYVAPASAGFVWRSSRAQAKPSAVIMTAPVSKVGTLPIFWMPTP